MSSPRRKPPDVEAFLDALTHRRIAEIRALRDAIVSAVPDITERVKWNAPSFGLAGDDRITFRLQPNDRVELVFHRGAKVRTDTESFRFIDPTGWIVWQRPDRGVVAFADASETTARLGSVGTLARRWLDATP